jgi:hypothetical protein
MYVGTSYSIKPPTAALTHRYTHIDPPTPPPPTHRPDFTFSMTHAGRRAWSCGASPATVKSPGEAQRKRMETTR